MEFGELSQLILQGLQPVLESHAGVELFARERARFDGWLTVELCRVLHENGLNPDPEGKRWDVTCGKWGIEVRAIGTGVRHAKAKDIKRSTTRSVETLIKDIWKLTNPGRSVSFANRAVLFVVYPLNHDDDQWQAVHYQQIAQELSGIEHLQLELKNGLPAVLYFGLCS